MNRYGSLLVGLTAVLVLWIAAMASTGADAAESGLAVTVEPERLSTGVGVEAEVNITVANNTAEPTADLALHIDITDPTGEGSVDPEDWTPTLTRFADPLGPGERVTQTWKMTPISPGDFVLYAVALSTEAGVEPAIPSVSNGVPVHVAVERSFNPQGVLPVALGVPGLVGIAWIWRFRRQRAT